MKITDGIRLGLGLMIAGIPLWLLYYGSGASDQQIRAAYQFGAAIAFLAIIVAAALTGPKPPASKVQGD